ncbi:hypothetical protein LIER_13543 [Lithospermum erythrorhizon]|uniref:Uncharacterized protein n=1 Tax=Lithospermum erythrorhizon TaxID=34254 RepID=A0AAV3PZZ6_LITER
MGTKVQYKSCFGGYNPMRDLDDDLNGNRNSWPFLCGGKPIPNAGFVQRTTVDLYPGYDKNALKHKMLEHEAIFKNQVHELHRLYKIQRDMMEEIKTKEHCRYRGSIEPSSSSIQGSQVPADDRRKWNLRSYPLVDSYYPRSTVPGAENVNSPLSYTKGNSTRVASQNGFPKGFDVSEARPSKVRKKLFDLQLPADEYVDIEDDEQQDNNVSGHLSSTSSKEFKTASESSMKLTVGGVKMGGLQGGFSSVSHCRSSTGLADLNEPINIEEVNESSPANIFSHSACNGRAKGVHFSAKPIPGFPGLQKEAMQKSTLGNQLYSLNSMSSENKINGREWFEAGSGRGNYSSDRRGVQLENQVLPPSQAMLNQAYPSWSHLTDHSKEDPRKERLCHGLDASRSSHEYSNHNPLPFMNSSNDTGTWPQLMQSLGKPAYILKPKLTSFHTHPSFGSSPSLTDKGLQSSALSNNISRDSLHVNISFSSNPCLVSDLPSNNGFYQGSSSGSKDVPVCFSSVGSNHLNGNRSDKTASEVHQLPFPWLRSKPTFKSEASNSRREVISINASPPHASPSLLSRKSKVVIDLNQVYNDTYASNNYMRSDNELNGIPIDEKILGVPVFEKLGISENRVSPLLSPTIEAGHAKHERKNRLIDINVACDDSLNESEEEPVVDELDNKNQLDKSSCARNFIDLNTFFAEDEDRPVPTVGSITSPKKVVVDIDLETPAIAEEEDDFLPMRDKEQEQAITLHQPDNDTEQAEDEGMRDAAEVIVDISSYLHINLANVLCSPSDIVEEELLLWFADVVSTSPSFAKEGSYKVMDDFEEMTLQLPETKEEDFMPEPFVPEVQELEETGTPTLPIRPRRGQARRGRQRRDFQRDILPGLVSLSRHEVTEDLQTFGGLMKAMGHSWNSGLARRNGGRNGSGRGRRRTMVETAPAAPPPCSQLIQQLDNVETSVEKRSLTSWGKTTRRPRRQRCPVVNAPTVAST